MCYLGHGYDRIVIIDSFLDQEPVGFLLLLQNCGGQIFRSAREKLICLTYYLKKMKNHGLDGGEF